MKIKLYKNRVLKKENSNNTISIVEKVVALFK